MVTGFVNSCFQLFCIYFILVALLSSYADATVCPSSHNTAPTITCPNYCCYNEDNFLKREEFCCNDCTKSYDRRTCHARNVIIIGLITLVVFVVIPLVICCVCCGVCVRLLRRNRNTSGVVHSTAAGTGMVMLPTNPNEAHPRQQVARSSPNEAYLRQQAAYSPPNEANLRQQGAYSPPNEANLRQQGAYSPVNASYPIELGAPVNSNDFAATPSPTNVAIPNPLPQAPQTTELPPPPAYEDVVRQM